MKDFIILFVSCTYSPALVAFALYPIPSTLYHQLTSTMLKMAIAYRAASIQNQAPLHHKNRIHIDGYQNPRAVENGGVVVHQLIDELMQHTRF